MCFVGKLLGALMQDGRAGLADAAQAALPFLGIPQPLWAEACITLGRERAALCLLLLEAGLNRPGDGRHKPVKNPAGYFRGLIRRGRAGRLDLAASLYALAGRAAAKPGDAGRRAV